MGKVDVPLHRPSDEGANPLKIAGLIYGSLRLLGGYQVFTYNLLCHLVSPGVTRQKRDGQMCGVAGIASLSGAPIEQASERITRMTRLLDHRGPDQWGTVITPDGLLALGNTRLSIVDPHAQFELPFRTSEDAVLSFNGEIYNYLDVRRTLMRQGIAFQTETDTEVLYHALRENGPEVLERLDGMWAIAYYDVSDRRLLLSRDVMGERHLFYHIGNGEIIFASEMEPILADRRSGLELDFEAAMCSLCYSTAPPGRTLVRGFRRLRPGHNLRVDLRDGSYEECRYRQLHPERWLGFFREDPPIEEVIEAFSSVFDGVVTRRLPRDVPFMSTLSGGIDSTIISVAASDYGKRKIKTLYGLSTEKPPRRDPDILDELEASQITSAKYGTDHHLLNMYTDDCVPVVNHVAGNGFDGCLDPGVVSFEMLALKARQEGAKVMLISDGPDELAGGYNIDRIAYTVDQLREGSRFRYEGLRFLSENRLASRLMRHLGLTSKIIPPGNAYNPFSFIPIHSSISPETIVGIAPCEMTRDVIDCYGAPDEDYSDLLPELDFTQVRALTYATKSLPDLFNLRTDKAFMHASVECRVPFQAPDVVEFLIAMPARLRFGDGGTTKYFLRKIVERLVGPEVAFRSKYGFGRPAWRDPRVREAIGIDDAIRDADLFKMPPFKPAAQDVILRPEHEKARWPLFVLAKTAERLHSGNLGGHRLEEDAMGEATHADQG